MVRNIFSLVLFLCSILGFSQIDQLKIMSFNIRMATPNDGINQWDNRKDWVSDIIFFNETDLVGLQELTYPQLLDLEQRLVGYDYIGQGREGETKGEYSAIFYLKDRFKVLDSGTFWLSETPNTPNSKSWDSSLPRIVTWGKFEDLTNGKIFYHYNTHFDHKGPVAREKAVEVLQAHLPQIPSDQAIVLTGDLNLAPTATPYQKILDLGFIDTQNQAMYKSEIGFTTNAWNIQTPKTNRIDYIFVKGNALSSLKYQELDIQRGPLFASDHYPVLTTFRWVDLPKTVYKKPESIRVLNYNIHHGVGVNDKMHYVDLNSLSNLIKQQDIDVITLQEVDVNTLRSGKDLNQIAKLAEDLNMYYTFGKTIDFQDGQYGIAILSKYPILEQQMHLLDQQGKQEEQRGLLIAQLQINNAPFSIATTHLSSNNAKSRELQSNQIIQINQKTPIDVLTGDWNDIATSKPVSILQTSFEMDPSHLLENTIPVLNPNKKIDYVAKNKNRNLSISNYRVLNLQGLSDHCAIICDIELHS